MRNFEIQLGHLCNDRCLFCISGQLTHQRQAPLLGSELLVERVRTARAAGYDRLTLLGGEPTIQPAFLAVVERAVEVGFKEIVVFSNGSRLARKELVDRILATGGKFEFRFSFQGGTAEAHEATTRRKGSFAQLLRAAEYVGSRDQKVTINTVLTAANYQSIPALAEVVRRTRAVQLHLDVINPYDVPVLPESELKAMQVWYPDLELPLLQLALALPRGFDVNVGNLPVCVAPRLAPWIHHGGPTTWTVSAAVDGRRALPIEKDKYGDKGRRKHKRAECRSCLFEASCPGYFARYGEWFGEAGFVPVSVTRIGALVSDGAETPVGGHEWARIFLALRAALSDAGLDFRLEPVASDAVRVAAQAGGSHLVALASVSAPRADARAEGASLGVESYRGDTTELLRWLKVLTAALGEPICPPASDAFGLRSPLQGRLERLRAAAPFPPLKWTRTNLSQSTLECYFQDPQGAEIQLWWRLDDDGVRGGYRAPPKPGPQTLEALRSLLAALGKAPAAPRFTNA